MLEYELKFAVPNHRLAPIVEFVDMVCEPDPVFPLGIVSSIYFDTTSMSSVFEKINSDYIKTKYRLRWYSNPVTGELSTSSFAESKRRIGCRRVKKRKTSPIEPQQLETIDLNSHSLSNIPYFMQLNDVGARGDLFPTFLVRYKRYRYVEPVTRSRISIDADISAPKINFFMLPNGTASCLFNAVIEVKGTQEFLPTVLRPLINHGVRRVSFSKYAACYAKSLQINFDPK